MAGNPIYIYDSSETSGSDFFRLGDPGKYYKSIKFTGGQLDLTGSNYGYAAVVVKAGSLATASLSGGGTIGLTDLSAGTVYELSLSQISGSTTTAARVYVFKRQNGF
jgi:hypothetical protein